ncbi:hypothetical protein B0A48_11960 [Cryoendolithus antarcticus]|uniref:Uncharacterized protein n=1 Tax=Cryoendolithus antarcticus TaxID=1507870 RepID=A0A1V8STD7_9PEZI|nr:hypothetical protein B0A48_11960 [Cryoendolithus antarcticus]
MIEGWRDGYWLVRAYKTHKRDDAMYLGRRRGMKLAETLNQPELGDRHRRYDCGYLTYDNCSLTELNQFRHQRGLAGLLCTNEPEAIRQLHTADDEATFSFLFALPKELRIQIYEYNCSYFGNDILYAPAQPPLTRVSRQLRREVLPVFYERCIFNLHVSPPSPICQIVAETASFFEIMGSDNLALVRNIQLCTDIDCEVTREQSRIPLEFVEECADIWLAQDGHSYELDVDVTGHDPSRAVWESIIERQGSHVRDFGALKHAIEAALRPVLDGIVERQENRGKLCMKDLTELAHALQECWKDEAKEE